MWSRIQKKKEMNFKKYLTEASWPEWSSKWSEYIRGERERPDDSAKMRLPHRRAQSLYRRYNLPHDSSVIKQLNPLPMKPLFNIRWVVPNIIARSGRPGYPKTNLGTKIVNEWFEELKNKLGKFPKTIITFLSNAELAEFYAFPLLDYYRSKGIEVYHVPVDDPIFDKDIKKPTFNFDQLHKIFKWVKSAKKPVLIHCSAGVDRTGIVSEYLKSLYGEPKTDKEKSIEPETKSNNIEKFKSKYPNWNAE